MHSKKIAFPRFKVIAFVIIAIGQPMFTQLCTGCTGI